MLYHVSPGRKWSLLAAQRLGVVKFGNQSPVVWQDLVNFQRTLPLAQNQSDRILQTKTGLSLTEGRDLANRGRSRLNPEHLEVRTRAFLCQGAPTLLTKHAALDQAPPQVGTRLDNLGHVRVRGRVTPVDDHLAVLDDQPSQLGAGCNRIQNGGAKVALRQAYAYGTGLAHRDSARDILGRY